MNADRECELRVMGKIASGEGFAVPLTPGPSPRWGEGKVNNKSGSLSLGWKLDKLPQGRVRGCSVQVRSHQDIPRSLSLLPPSKGE